MKIAYWYKKHKAVPLADAMVDAFNRAGIDCYYLEDDLEEDTDLVVAVGGDGTILSLVHKLDFALLPVLAINGGTTGFLTQDYGDLDQLANRLLDGDYALVPKRLLGVYSEDGEEWLALGDVAICRKDAVTAVSVDIAVDGEHVFSYRGDGVVVATPLGSTGYSLSAGGVPLAPSVDALAVTPLAPHSLCVRPFVVSTDACISLEVSGRDGLCVALDGKVVLTESEVKLNVSASDKWLKMIQFDNKYFEKLTDKLATW